jgi:4-hydroxy-2-oxoheptanedioate aldolase
MNKLERRMVDVLRDLRENHHVVGVKAEFEAEGTRLEEALRLKDVISKAGLDLTIKIGGCEALKDMYDARSIGVTTVVAPMVESAYALSKYLKCVRMAFPEDEREGVKFLINVETVQACRSFGEMVALPDLSLFAGVVFGRVDLTGSMGRDREYVNSDEVLALARDVFGKAKSNGLECVVGGGVSKDSIPFLKKLPVSLVDRYETRKVIFKCPEATEGACAEGILKAVGFELMWLKNKRNFYGLIFEEDRQRLEMLESRYATAIAGVGGHVG